MLIYVKATPREPTGTATTGTAAEPVQCAGEDVIFLGRRDPGVRQKVVIVRERCLDARAVVHPD